MPYRSFHRKGKHLWLLSLRSLHGLTQSVQSKIILLIFCVALVMAGILVLIAGLVHSRSQEVILNTAIEGLAGETRLTALRFKNAFNEMQNDAFVVSRTPPVHGLMRAMSNGGIDPLDGSTTYHWSSRMATIFSSVMQERPHYTRMRYIGIADNGPELVAVHRQGGRLEKVPPQNLQHKAGEPFFRNALALKEGESYFSDITYSREQDEADLRLMPTIRVIIPVFDEQGAMFGMVVVNADYEKLLIRTLEEINPSRDIYITNQQGDYLQHDRDGTIHKFVFSQSHVAPPDFIRQVLGTDQTEIPLIQDGRMGYFVRLQISAQNPRAFIGIILRASRDELLANTDYKYRDILYLTLVLVALTVLLALLISRRVSAPLRAMTEQLKDADKKGVTPDLPIHLKDEIGDLARAFDDLAGRLLESRARAQTILDNVVDGIITIDERGKIESANKACEKLFQYAPAEVVDKNVNLLMPEPYHSQHDRYLSNYRETGQKKIIGKDREVAGRRKDGTVFPIDLSVSEIRLRGKRVFTGIVRDITARKAAEEELAGMLERLSQSNTELERFAYVASHDLQKPLRMVVNFADLLHKKYEEKLDEDGKRYIAYVVNSAARMQAMVSDLLEFSRINAEAESQQDVDTAASLKYVLENLAESINASGAVITHDPLPVIRGNAIRFARLLQNLVGNALKYRKAGVSPEIHISVASRPKAYEFRVRDNGIGMKPEYCEQIFLPFKRLHGKEEYEGTGIGLAICAKIVASMGGKIRAESEPGKGSTFIFTVPKNLKENPDTSAAA